MSKCMWCTTSVQIVCVLLREAMGIRPRASRRRRSAFTVPVGTCRVVVVGLILAHERRHIVHVNRTERPTAQGLASQIVDALPSEICDHPGSLHRIAGLRLHHTLGQAVVPQGNAQPLAPETERHLGLHHKRALRQLCQPDSPSDVLALSHL
jgi:hypothetical protein